MHWNGHTALLLVAAPLAMVAHLSCQRSLAEVATIQLPKGMTVEEVWHEDVSGDGRKDVLIAAHRTGTAYDRTLRIHYGLAGRSESKRAGFNQTPDVIASVPRSISAAAVGDVHGDAGSEVIWFGARGAYAWRPKAEDAKREVKLTSGEFLYQYPDPSSVLDWQIGVRDLDGDGLVDLILPEPQGFRIAIQRRDGSKNATFESTVLTLPAAPRKNRDGATVRVGGARRGNRFDLGISLGGTSRKRRAALVNISEEIPAPQIHDWNGDGRSDIIAKRGENVFVWLQKAGGRYRSETDARVDFPLTEEQTRLDPRFSTSLTDFDRDRRVDAVLIAKDRNSEELRTQIMFFPQKKGTPLFAGGRPSQLIVLPGFTSPPRLTDINSDGLPDLQIASWRLDVLDQVTSGGSQSLDIELYVYINKKGRFPRRPNLTHKATIEGEVLRDGGDRLFSRFLGDVSGDGVSELLARPQPDKLQLHLVRLRNDKLTIIERPLWKLSIDKEAVVQHFPPDAKRKGFIVIEDSQVLLVQF